MVRELKILSVVLFTVLLVACSSSGSMQLTQAKTAPIPSGKIVALKVGLAPIPDSSYSGATEVTRRLKAQLFGRLVSEGAFRQVVQFDEPADYRMEVLLSDTREVSPGARILLGVMAGANSLNASVTLYDQATSSVVTAFDVEGKSASHPFSTESGLDDAIREAIDKIMLVLQ